MPAAGGRPEKNVDRAGGAPVLCRDMASTVHVALGARSYDIVIGQGLLPLLGEGCKKLGLGRNSLVVTDMTVAPLHGEVTASSLAGSGFQVGRALVPAGEQSKDIQILFHVYQKAVEQGLDRKSFMVALGGGVVGDLAGFAAATFLRGIDFVQVPTTLLAMVDSAVGGKTGINLPQGKNLVGSFHQPRLVIADLDLLKTLPPREIAAGMAEVVKYGVIKDATFFAMLEKNADAIRNGDANLLEQIVRRSCEIKGDVVGRDEREEGGLRAILNFGHTIGHAIEAVTGYGTYLHGEAIAIGMVYAARLSAELLGMPKDDVVRLDRLLRRFSLPTELPDCPWQPIRRAMGMDKKSKGGSPRFVLAEKIGVVREGVEVSEDVLQRLWEDRSPVRGHGF